MVMVMVTVMEMEGGGEGTRCHQLGMGEQRAPKGRQEGDALVLP